jgi:DUF4097 and DUF4098 domain-containing protein YvlB
MLRSLASLPVLFLSACHLSLRDHVTVDGVRLPAHHEEVLTLEAWPGSGFVIQSHQGDVRIEQAPGPTTITVLVHERELGEAHAHIEDGRLVARAENGAKCAIGRVHVRTSGPVTGLEIATGMGDVELRDVRVEGRLAIETGMGDVDVAGVGEPQSVELSSGMGDVGAARLRCARFEADTGMGDVRVDGLEAGEVELSSGMGDVDVARSRGERIEASSGMGDVELVESSFTTRDLDTGLGRVRER